MIFFNGKCWKFSFQKNYRACLLSPSEDVSDNETAIQFGTMIPEEDSQLILFAFSSTVGCADERKRIVRVID